MRSIAVQLAPLYFASLGLVAHAAPPCAAPEYRQFDFWLGQWQVLGADRKPVGTNRIEREYDGCVVHERYTTPRGYTGESLNIYDASRKIWHQTWVDSDGLLLVLEGGLQDGKMVLQGQTRDDKGQSTKHRITWTPNPDGSVRQLWESTDRNGIWTVTFDGHYVRT